MADGTGPSRHPASRSEGDPVQAEIDGIASDGSGVGRLPDGRAVFVPGTVPGDRVDIEVVRSGARWARGRLSGVRQAGEDRRDPPCPLYGSCGGCTLQHLAYPGQLRAKERMVLESLRRIGGLEVVPAPVVHPSPREFGYRNRMTFTLRRLRAGRVVAGLHERERPGRILEVDGRCLLAEDPVREAWAALREAWGPGANALPAGGELRLTLRGTEEGDVVLLVRGGRGRGTPERLLDAVPGLRAVWHRPSGSGAAEFLAGQVSVEERWLGERWTLEPEAFLQVNRSLARTLHEAVEDALGEVAGLRVVDAYCGTGMYGRAAALRGAALATGIELDPAAARVAGRPGPAAFRVLEGRVSGRLHEALPADVVLLNPPRSGVEEGVMEELAEAPPARIVYASCDPATLARDVARLLRGAGPAAAGAGSGEDGGEAGYRVARLELFDLFPQTANVETLLVLERGSASGGP